VKERNAINGCTTSFHRIIAGPLSPSSVSLREQGSHLYSSCDSVPGPILPADFHPASVSEIRTNADTKDRDSPLLP